jgi:plasmid rolling circle replication initiator protein Rep
MAKYTATAKGSQVQKDIVVRTAQRKVRNLQLADFAVKIMTSGVVARMRGCGTYMEFLASADLSAKKLHSANFCGNRFCPLCGWRQARKDALKIDVLMRYLEKEHGKAFIFLTLTAPNVVGPELPKALDDFNRAFNDMKKLADFKAVNLGYIRKLEITYNAERNDFHPHFHVLIAVDKQYFAGRNYIKHERWLNMWRQSMRDESITQVNIKRVARDSSSEAQAELAKYAAKDSDMLISPEVFESFYYSLKGRQVLTYSGLFAQAHKLYKAGELNAFKNPDETEYLYMLLYRWGKGEYIEAEKRGLTPKERIKLNGQQLNEADID